MPFAVFDKDRSGPAAVLVMVDDMAEAQAIAMDLRRTGRRADVVAVPDGASLESVLDDRAR